MKTATFERFEFEMPDESISACHHQGQCDEDVEFWVTRIDLSAITDEQLRAELREYGAWSDDELQDRHANELRIVWIAAGNISEES